MSVVKIRPSTPADLKVIHEWMEDEDRRHVPGNFFCNWKVIERAHGKDLLVAETNGEIVGYQIGRLLCPGILQIKYEWRRKGIGTEFIDYLCNVNSANDELFLYIQCEPPESIPFWEGMGFTTLGEDSRGKTYAYRTLPRKSRQRRGGSPVGVAVCVSFLPKQADWQSDVQPLVVHQVNGQRHEDNTIDLSDVVLFHEEQYGEPDVVLRVEVDGTEVYKGKAKYQEAAARGLKRCRNGWFLETLEL